MTDKPTRPDEFVRVDDDDVVQVYDEDWISVGTWFGSDKVIARALRAAVEADRAERAKTTHLEE
jgi:hypothetical protein